ncbi:MAG TPA: hypothetical protein VGE52_15095 [Pirellulales bacterium]
MPKRKRLPPNANGPTNSAPRSDGTRLDTYLAYRGRLDEWRAELLPRISPSDVGFLLYDMKLAKKPSAAASALAALTEEDHRRIEDYLLFGRRGWIATPMAWRAMTTLARDDVDRALGQAIRQLRCALMEVRSLDGRGGIEARDLLRGEDVSLFEPPVARALQVGVIFSAQLLPFDEFTITTGAPMVVGRQGSPSMKLILMHVRDLLGLGDEERPLTKRESRKLAFVMLWTILVLRKSLS